MEGGQSLIVSADENENLNKNMKNLITLQEKKNKGWKQIFLEWYH